MKVIVEDAPLDAAHYARLDSNLADATILGNLLGTSATTKAWKYASIRRTDQGDFVLWQGKVDPAGLGNPRKILKALLQRAQLSTDVDVLMLDAEGIVTMELEFESRQAVEPASGSSGDVVTKAFASDGTPVEVNDVHRAMASRLIDDSYKQNVGARKGDLCTYPGSGNLALDDAAPASDDLALGDAPVGEYLALGAAPFSGNLALAVVQPLSAAEPSAIDDCDYDITPMSPPGSPEGWLMDACAHIYC